MADHAFRKGLGYLENNVVEFFGAITIGSSGAVDATNLTNGITSIALTGTGGYIVTLDSTYNALLWADAELLHSTDSAATTVGIGHRINAESVASAGTVTFQFYALDDGADANPASGAKLFFRICCRNSDVA